MIVCSICIVIIKYGMALIKMPLLHLQYVEYLLCLGMYMYIDNMHDGFDSVTGQCALSDIYIDQKSSPSVIFE